MRKKFKGIKKKLREKLSHSKRRVRNIFSDKNKQIFVRGFFYGCCIGAILHAYPAYGQEAGGNFTNAKDMKPKKPRKYISISKKFHDELLHDATRKGRKGQTARALINFVKFTSATYIYCVGVIVGLMVTLGVYGFQKKFLIPGGNKKA